jgi:hypothetical protein
MDIGKAFTFVFDDEDWIVKILIAAAILLVGSLFSWVLLIPLFLAFAILGGYQIEIMRRVIQGDSNPLPAWDNWGDLIVDGIKVIVIGIVYALPAIIISVCLGVPSGLLGEDAPGLSSLFGILGSCLSFVWAIVMSIVLPAALAFFVADGEMSAAFRFGDVLAFTRDNLSTYLITFVMSWVAYIIGSLGSIVCGVGALVTTPYAYMVVGHLYGQAYLDGLNKAPAPVLDEEII